MGQDGGGIEVDPPPLKKIPGRSGLNMIIVAYFADFIN